METRRSLRIDMRNISAALQKQKGEFQRTLPKSGMKCGTTISRRVVYVGASIKQLADEVQIPMLYSIDELGHARTI
jgi:hypothetical protein